MSDLCAPIYVVMDGEEEMTFWCFMQVMERMVCASSVMSPRCPVLTELTETELPPRSERNEEATDDIAATYLRDGPGAV